MDKSNKDEKDDGRNCNNKKHIEPIDIGKLKAIEKSNSRKMMKNRDDLLSSYLSLVHNAITIHMTAKSKEMSKFVVALDHFINQPKAARYNLKKGDIIEVEFGLKYQGETAYRHTAIVIQALKNSIFVVPVTSNPQKVRKAKNGNSQYLQLLDENDGLDHECVAVLDNASFIVPTRILSKINGKQLSTEKIEVIRKKLMNGIFSDECKEYDWNLHRMDLEYNNLLKQCEDKNKDIRRLKKKLYCRKSNPRKK